MNFKAMRQPFPSGTGWLLIKTLLVMKLTFIVVAVSCLQVSAKGYSQTITLSLKNARLETVFKEIEKQTAYNFFYGDVELQKAGAVSLEVNEAALEKVLQLCLANQPITYTIVEKVIILRSKATKKTGARPLLLPPLPIDVKGKVTNDKNEPVSGATIAEKGTKKLTTTNEKGEFFLEGVGENAVLLISHISFETQEVRITEQTELIIQLKLKVNDLSDVAVIVNTGYQQIPRERATGSFAVINNKTLNQQVGTNILQRLDGVTSGLQFIQNKADDNRKLGISIRGLSTINGPLDPLIVVDGFIYEGSIENINPNMVDNITILKDAAAASIWGARAGNGVIVITSKKGNFNQKLQVDFSSNIIIGSKPDLFSLPEISSSDYIDVEQTLFNNGYFDGQINFEPHRSLTPAVEIFLSRRNGLISSADSASQINALKQHDIRNDYEKYFYTRPVTQQYSLGLRGGSNNNAYTLGIGYDKTLGELHNQFNKLNIQLNNVYKPIKNLQISLGVQYTNSENKSGRPSYDNIVRVNSRRVPYLSLADNNGNPMSVAHQYREEYISALSNGKLLDWRFFPLDDYKYRKTTSNLQEWFSVAGIQYKLFKFLDIDFNYQYQRQQTEAVQLDGINSYFTRDIINKFSQVDPSTGVVTYIVPAGDIRQKGNLIAESHTARGQFNFNHGWKDNAITAILGAEIRQANSHSDNITTYGYKADPLSYANIDFVNTYPTIVTGNPENISGSPSYSKFTNRFVSVFTNIAYTLRDKYIVSVSGRRDGANIFGATTNDKWKPLWSAGAAWHLSREKFYKSSLLPELKIRATYGKSGNIDLRKSPLPLLSYATDFTTNLPAALIFALNDPSLRWEEVSTMNFAVEFSTRKNSISGFAEFYIKKGADLYGETPYDYTTYGAQRTRTRNVANMEGKGIEIGINSKNLNKELKWSTSLLFNYYRDKTTKYYTTNATTITSLLSGGSAIYPVIGKPLYSIAAYKWGGLDASGNPQGFLDGQLSTDYLAIVNEGKSKGVDGNIVYIGPAIPTFYGSLINSFSWKNFSVNFNISYKFGYFFQKPTISYLGLISNGNGHSDFAKRWQKPGDEAFTNVPSFIYPISSTGEIGLGFYQNSEILVVKADHIRLQYVNFNYSLARQGWNRNLFKEMQLFMNISNLGIVWRANKEKLDPDYPSAVSPGKSFAFGIRANF